MDGVDIFLSDKLNKNLLEEHFGMVRSGGGASDNPTQERFGQMNRKIVLVKSGFKLSAVIRGEECEKMSLSIYMIKVSCPSNQRKYELDYTFHVLLIRF